MNFAMKYIHKLAQSVNTARAALDIIKHAPEKAFEEDINERIKACDVIITNLQEARRYLIYFRNQKSPYVYGGNTPLEPPK